MVEAVLLFDFLWWTAWSNEGRWKVCRCAVKTSEQSKRRLWPERGDTRSFCLILRGWNWHGGREQKRDGSMTSLVLDSKSWDLGSVRAGREVRRSRRRGMVHTLDDGRAEETWIGRSSTMWTT